MSRCKCMQSRKCNGVSPVASNTNNNNNNNNNNRCTSCGGGGNNCCCCCCCCCGGGRPQRCNDTFCILKSYLEEVQGWEHVVRPCSNYHHHHHHHKGEEVEMNEALAELMQNGELLEELKKLPALLNNFNFTEMLGNLVNENGLNLDEMQETVFD